MHKLHHTTSNIYLLSSTGEGTLSKLGYQYIFYSILALSPNEMVLIHLFPPHWEQGDQNLHYLPKLAQLRSICLINKSATIKQLNCMQAAGDFKKKTYPS